MDKNVDLTAVEAKQGRKTGLWKILIASLILVCLALAVGLFLTRPGPDAATSGAATPGQTTTQETR